MAEDVKTEEQTTEIAAETAAPAAEVQAEPVAVLDIRPGMVIRVHQKIKETNTKGEERERVQIFEGTVLAVKGKDAQSRTVHVRKIASGVGVERIFPVKSPAIAKFEVVKQYAVKRSKLYYVRTSKKALLEKPPKGPVETPKGKTGAKKKK